MDGNWLKYKPAIIPYKGKYVDNWFSNMTTSPFIAGDQTFQSVEHFYQAMKAESTLEFQMIASAKTPYEAKKLGRRVDKPFEYLVETVADTEELVKLHVMEIGLTYKFEIPEWREKLLSTGEERIIEWNNWGDLYWGADVKTGKGLNHLGLLLEKVREKIKKELES